MQEAHPVLFNHEKQQGHLPSPKAFPSFSFSDGQFSSPEDIFSACESIYMQSVEQNGDRSSCTGPWIE